jgi:hypothetical protein
MDLNIVDLIVIGVYLLATIAFGFILKKKAQKNNKSYLQGGIENGKLLPFKGEGKTYEVKIIIE